MKALIASLAITTVLALIAWSVGQEWLWDLDHHPIGAESGQPFPGEYVAQVRGLPEGDAVAPYGQGVYLRRRLTQRWSTSTLVFAGYCAPEVSLKWLSARELAVGCKVTEGAPKLLPAPKGIVVTVHGGGN